MGCFTFVKVVMVLFNLLICLAGMCMASVGIWVTLNTDAFMEVLPPFTDEFLSHVNVGIFSITIGAVMTLLGMLGCCGAQKESKCLLIMFFSIILIICIAEAAAAIVSLVYSSYLWPEPFPIPEFSHDVELTLQEANGRYAKDGSVLMIPKGMKTDILDTLADSMSKISPYPERQHYENVAKALVEKHPSLKEPGSGKGWYGWFHSLKFKLGNYRQKLSAAGCPEVRVNKRKGEEAKGPRMKKSKKGEVHYCPDPPEGLSDEDMEEKRRMMEVEVLKKDLDHQQIDNLMSDTFSKRRKEIVGDQPLIGDVMARWPAMFCERQVRAEFKRVVSTDLLESFLDGLDDLAPRLLEVYEAATKSAKKPALKAILDCLKKDDTNERRRTAALLGLPHYLREEPSDIIRMCDAHGETLAEAMEGMQLGLLIGYEGDNQDAFPHEIFNVAVVVEETVVLHNFKDVPSSFAMLLGIIYCVNLEYPQAMKYSFEFLQRVVMKIKPDQASARVHGIRNKLLRYKL
ncbi:sterile alpha motif domain-containing protein 3-like [Pimephales promelas]|nr:sterile alpha motif domain-containing protein 3-like [Pimephales promelas]